MDNSKEEFENMVQSAESTPLLPGESSKYYFLNQENHQGGTTESVRDSDGGQVVEGIPAGSNADEFAPRVIGAKKKVSCYDI